MLLGFFKTVYKPFFLRQSGSFLNLSWSYLNQDLCCVHCNFCDNRWTIVLVWAIGVSLVFLLKLIGSCGEQLINLAGFLISTGSRNWLVWAIGISLVFLLKLIRSCGEQLINLAGFWFLWGVGIGWLIVCEQLIELVELSLQVVQRRLDVALCGEPV